MRRVRRSSGMTLVEVVVAALALAIGICGLVGTMYFSAREEAASHEVSIALAAIRAKVEEVRSHSFQDTYAYYNQDANRHFEVPTLLPQAGDNDIFDPHRPGEVVVSVITADLLRVAVHASWTGILGDQSIETTTEMTDRLKEGE